MALQVQARLTREVLDISSLAQHSEIENYHVLSLGKSQERSDSDGGYRKYVASVNNPLLGHATYSAVEIPCPNKNCTCFCSGVF